MKEQPIGLDIGTMFLVSAEKSGDGQITFSKLRNMFLRVDDPMSLDLSKISHAIIDNELFILSEDAYSLPSILGHRVDRPMVHGFINPTEINSLDVLSTMIKRLIGTCEGNFPCCFSVPGNPIDLEANVLYHRKVLERIVKSLGYNPIPLNEAAAIVLSECDNFNGIGISFGAGATNVAITYKAIPVFDFCVVRGGDWIDENAANATGTIPSRITSLKERHIDLSNFEQGEKRERRIREAVVYYYAELIRYTLNTIMKELVRRTEKLNLPDEIPLVVSGGTSLAQGFMTLFNQLLDSYRSKLPFKLSEVRQAKDPLNAVAEGCLIRALVQLK